MIKNDNIYLQHILENVDKILNSIRGMDKDHFKKDIDVLDAVIRRVEVIGEAVKNLSLEFKKANPKIEWKKIAGARDVLIHAYFDVDIDLLWGILREDIPKLRESVKILIKK